MGSTMITHAKLI